MPWAGSVDNIVALKAVTSQLRQDGFPLLVRSEADWFYYSSTNTSVPNDIDVVIPNDSVGRWLRSGVFNYKRKLTSSITIYVSTTGNDTSNSGLTAGSPLLTLQAALNLVAQLDIHPYTVTIQISGGTYTAPVVLPKVNGNVIIQGNISDPTDVVIQASGADSVITGTNVTNYLLSSFRINSLVSGDLITLVDSNIRVNNIILGNCLGNNSISLVRSKLIVDNLFAANGPTTGNLISATKQSYLEIIDTVTALANFTVGTVINCSHLSLVDLTTATFDEDVYIVTGSEFNVELISIITGTTPFGSVAGTVDTTTFGQFI